MHLTRLVNPLLRSRLVQVEAFFVLLWIALCVVAFAQVRGAPRMVPLDPAALATGPSMERWMGIYYQDQPVGFSVSSETETSDGGRLVQQRSVMRIASFGQIHRVVTAGTALVRPDGLLDRFDFLLSTDTEKLAVQGQVREREIHLDIHQRGEVQALDLPVEEPPQLLMSLPAAVARQPLAVGHTFEVPFFDPISLSRAAMRLEVTDVEILPDGEEAYWIGTEFSGQKSRMLVTPAGDVIREESPMGFSMVRTTREQAEALSVGGDPIDMVRLSMVPVDVPIHDAREKRTLVLEFEGVEEGRIPSFPPRQEVEGRRLTLRAPLMLELPSTPLLAPEERANPPEELRPFLAATTFLPAAHPEILARAEAVAGEARTRLEITRRLVDWVHGYLRKRPVVGVPNGLEVLRAGEGDCNEHTALFVTMARALGLPARTASGIVYAEYSDGSNEYPGFYYHAWPEVHLGGDLGWVAVDPTFGQLPADATHVKLVEGELDRQVEIMGFIGRLRVHLVEAR
jgi:hypothetical protein